MSWNQIIKGKVESFKRHYWVIFILFLALISFIFYGSSISNGYNLDDHFIYTENPKAINGLSNVADIFKKNSFEGSTYNFGYRPITVLSFAIENQLFGLNPQASHFINVLLYAILAILFAYFLRAIFPEKSALWLMLCCLLFVVMPLHSEMVNNVKSRDELLMLIFGLMATLSAIKNAQEMKFLPWSILTMLFLMLSILAKKSGFVFLGIIPVSLYYLRPVSLVQNLKISSFLIVPVLGFKLIKKFIKESKGEVHLRESTLIENPLYDPSVEVDRFVFSLESLEFYFQKLLFPTELVSYYGFDTIKYAGFDYSNIITLLIGLGLILLAIFRFQKKDSLSFSIILFFGCILPFLNILFPMVGIVADRFAGLASIGASIFIVSGIFLLSKKLLEKQHKIIVSSIIVLYSFYSFALVQERNKEWSSEEKLFKADVKKEPNSATLNGLIGKKLLYQVPASKSQKARNKLTQEAEFHLRKSLEIAEDKILRTELGNLLFRAKLDINGARSQYLKAIAKDSTYAEPHYHLAWLALHQNNKAQAVNHFISAIKLKGDYLEAYEPLIRNLAELGRYEEALTWNSKGKSQFPKSPLFELNEANIYILMGDNQRARAKFEDYLRLEPNDINARKRMEQL